MKRLLISGFRRDHLIRRGRQHAEVTFGLGGPFRGRRGHHVPAKGERRQ